MYMRLLQMKRAYLIFKLSFTPKQKLNAEQRPCEALPSA